MAGAKTVRLRSPEGAVVETSEDNATRLRGFEPVKAESPAAAKRSSSKSEK